MSAPRRRLHSALATGREHAVRLGNQLSEQTPLLGTNEQSGSLWSFPTEFARLTWHTLTSHVTNTLLVFLPIGIAAGASGWDPTAVFVLNFLAIVPLASLLSFATEELASVVGPTLGGLLNASFGNAVELIVSIIALRDGKIRIVQASMIGSVLSNTLLILGCCFIAGGMRRSEQKFNRTVASTMSSLMLVASASLVIPATMYGVVSKVEVLEDKINLLSRGTSIILLLLYVLYLFFQLRTHAELFEGTSRNDEIEAADDDHSGPQILRPVPALIALVMVTALIGICAEFLVNSIDAVTESGVVSETFLGLIVLPIVSNAAEHVTAVIVSYKDQMDLAMVVALGSGIQIPLLVTPLLVLLGWAIDQPMTLRFEIFETIVFLLTIMVMNNLIHDGKSNYFEGALCLGTYLIIALAFFVYPENAAETFALFKS